MLQLKRYSFTPGERFTLNMPKGAKPHLVERTGLVCYMWALADTSNSMKPYLFACRQKDDDCEELGSAKFLGTIIHQTHPTHVFLVAQ